jgi:hypothetical protein
LLSDSRFVWNTIFGWSSKRKYKKSVIDIF